jgi:hypothetical protein
MREESLTILQGRPREKSERAQGKKLKKKKLKTA